MRSNPLELSVKAISLPKRVSIQRYYQMLLEVVDGRRVSLPRGWVVEVRWRNALAIRLGMNPDSEDFAEAIQNSRGIFVDLIRGQLERGLSRMRGKR